MRIDITGIAGINGARSEISTDIPAKELGGGITGIELSEMVHADLKIEYMEGTISVKGRVKGSYKAQCARCLAEIEDFFDLDIEERLVHMSADTNDTENYLFDAGYIDLTVPLIDNILLSFPGVVLCNKDCKGLCQFCGVNLNETQCSCENHDIDIRMDKLKDFFNQ